MDESNSEVHENWYSPNIDESTVSALQYSKYSLLLQIQIQYVSSESLQDISFPENIVWSIVKCPQQSIIINPVSFLQ